MEGDRVVQLVTFSGTNTHGFMGVPPTGKKFTFAAALICTMRDGRIAYEQRIYDFAGFLMEIGVIKVKLA
jgi:predicted ester cyclase